MLYRRIGKAGLNVSEQGLGCEHLDGAPYEEAQSTIAAALSVGINIFDVFMPGEEIRGNIAKALGSKRKDVLIQGHIGSTDLNQKYDISRDMPVVKRYFEDMLRMYGGYIDFGMMFFIDSDEHFHKVFDTEFADYVSNLRDKGDIRCIGFSSHNPAIAAKVIETGLPEMMMFSVNPAFDMLPTDSYSLDQLEKGFDKDVMRGLDPERAALYTLCSKKGVGITTMKTLGAGKLLSAEHTPFASPMSVWQCMHYALTRPSVASAMIGCRSADEVLHAARYFELSDDEKDFSLCVSSMRSDFAGNCVYCSHCQPCPMDIDIARVNKYLDIARLDKDNIPDSVKSHYSQLAHSGSECSGCGNCTLRCPFGVPIPANMAEAHALLAY